MATNRGLSPIALATLCVGATCALLGIGFWIGQGASNPTRFAPTGFSLPPEILQATATHGGSTMAVCTASIDEESDGFFALDYITGDLKGWVFNPRTGGFGGLFATNVSQLLGLPGKNAEYLLVSGRTQPPASGSTARAASMVLYVVDVRSGQFAAFSVPWDRSMRNSGATQTNVLIPVGGDVIRSPIGPGGGGPRKPPAGNASPNANDPNAQDPNAPGKNANPPKNNQNNQNNQNKNNN